MWFKRDARNVPKQAKSKRDGVINPQNYTFSQFQHKKCRCSQNAANQPKSPGELAYMCPRGLSGPPVVLDQSKCWQPVYQLMLSRNCGAELDVVKTEVLCLINGSRILVNSMKYPSSEYCECLSDQSQWRLKSIILDMNLMTTIPTITSTEFRNICMGHLRRILQPSRVHLPLRTLSSVSFGDLHIPQLLRPVFLFLPIFSRHFSSNIHQLI